MEHYLYEEHGDETGGESHGFNVLLGAAHQFSGVVLPEEVLVLGEYAPEGLLAHASLHGRAYAVRGEFLYVFGNTCDKIDNQHGDGYGEEQVSSASDNALVYDVSYVFRAQCVEVNSDDKKNN